MQKKNIKNSNEIYSINIILIFFCILCFYFNVLSLVIIVCGLILIVNLLFIFNKTCFDHIIQFWIKIGFVLNKYVSILLFSLIYFIIFTPLITLTKVFNYKKDKFNDKQWKKIKKTEYDLNFFKDQF